MHSIQTKITALTLAAILVSVLTVGVVSVVSIKNEGERSSTATMDLLCENCRYSIDDYLTGIEHSVALVSRYAIEELNGIELAEGGVIGTDGLWESAGELERRDERQEKLDAYLAGYSDRVEDVFRSVANQTNGIVSFYYRISPEISMQSKGFLYSRDASNAFSEVALTKLERFAPDDVGHVGWYYIPIARGYPSWIEPYDNQNLGVTMVSYVAPLYKAGTFIGVIGMDISYATLISRIENIRIYQTGFAYLVQKDGTIVYHPTMESGSNLSEYAESFSDVVTVLAREDHNTRPIVYVTNGEEKQMYFSTLSSGLKLVVTAPVREINASTQRLGSTIMATSVLILIVFIAITAVMVTRLIGPLHRLIKASEQLAEGNYDVQLDYAGDDEVGTLTRAFVKLVEHLQIYISDLNSKAYQDAMTGLRNKGAYELSTQKLNDAIRSSTADEPAQFALVMFDCNDLKKINDTYGHEKGDEYLRTACGLICDVFAHSPVFRVGGDEFAAILQGESYCWRDELLEQFDEWAARINEHASEPWKRARIAKGVAVFDPAADRTAEDVLKRADAQMYEDKKRMKSAENRPEQSFGE